MQKILSHARSHRQWPSATSLSHYSLESRSYGSAPLGADRPRLACLVNFVGLMDVPVRVVRCLKSTCPLLPSPNGRHISHNEGIPPKFLECGLCNCARLVPTPNLRFSRRSRASFTTRKGTVTRSHKCLSECCPPLQSPTRYCALRSEHFLYDVSVLRSSEFRNESRTFVFAQTPTRRFHDGLIRPENIGRDQALINIRLVRASHSLTVPSFFTAPTVTLPFPPSVGISDHE